MNINERIKELVEAYPDVDLDSVDTGMLREMADRYLRAQRAKLWGGVHIDRIPPVADLPAPPTQRAERTRVRNIERIHADREKVSSAVRNAVDSVIRREAEVLKPKWLPSLLRESFALPDGTMVRWGEASVDQHETRASMLAAQAAGDLQTAALHREALSNLIESGAHNLFDLTTEQQGATA